MKAKGLAGSAAESSARPGSQTASRDSLTDNGNSAKRAPDFERKALAASDESRRLLRGLRSANVAPNDDHDSYVQQYLQRLRGSVKSAPSRTYDESAAAQRVAEESQCAEPDQRSTGQPSAPLETRHLLSRRRAVANTNARCAAQKLDAARVLTGTSSGVLVTVIASTLSLYCLGSHAGGHVEWRVTAWFAAIVAVISFCRYLKRCRRAREVIAACDKTKEG